MLKKVNLKKQILISVIFLGLTTGLFALAIFGSLGKSFDSHILLNHFFLGLAIGIYIFILIQFNFYAAFLLFILGYVFSFAILFYNYSFGQEGFTELAGFLGWIVVMILVIALGIAIEILLHVRRKQKALRLVERNSIEAEVIVKENHED